MSIDNSNNDNIEKGENMNNDEFVVFGSTGYLGWEIVRYLKSQNRNVTAIVRDMAKGKRLFEPIGEISMRQGDLTKPETLSKAIGNAKYVINAAGGFSPVGMFKQESSPEKVDYLGMKNLAESIKSSSSNDQTKLIQCSSVGVTRPSWFKCQMINLLTGGAIKWKKDGEESIRQTGINYCIIRPTHLLGGQKINVPVSSKSGEGVNFVADHGDKISGSIQRTDVAMIMVEAALNSETDKCTIDITSSDKRVNDTCSEPSHKMDILFANLKKD